MAYSCTLKIGSTTYTDLHRIIDFRTLSIVSPLCSTDKKSGKGTMSVSVVANRNIVYYRLFMTALLGAQEAQKVGDCEFTIIEDSTVVFRGFLDLSNIQINSAKLPQNLTLSAIDKSTLLDKKIRYNHYWENKKRSEIVQDLLAYLGTDYGISVTFLSNALPDSKKIKYFAVAEGKEQTYREVIDKILLESAGYVLWYDPVQDGFSIREIPTSTTGLTPRIVTYLVDNQLQTKSAIYNKDGVLLSFPNVVERPNTNIFTQDINNSIDEGGFVQGDKVQPGHYYPTDGDVKEIYQEYSIADRAYISGESRLQNENLKLLYAKDAKYYLASHPALSVADPIPLVKWKGTVEYYPDRARILFCNYNEKEADVSVFSITGTAVYQNYLNKVTVGRLDPSANGAACTNPEEYLADTIQYKEGDSDYSEAIAFAKWYYKSLNYGQTTSSWAELHGNAQLGEIVYVAHKETGVMMPHVIVQITNQSKNNSTIRMDRVTAISIYGWEEFVYDTGVTASGKGGEQVQRPNQWSSGTILKGETTARGVAGIIGDFYLNLETFNIYECTKEGTMFSAIWTYRGNIKGKDATVEGFTYSTEYGLSDSPVEFHFPESTFGYNSQSSYGHNTTDSYGYKDISDWSKDFDGWYKGLYVWTRIKVTDPEGNVSYEDPMYARDLTQSLINSCVLDIVLTDADDDGNTTTWEKNLAATTTPVALQPTIYARSYRNALSFKSVVTTALVKFYKNGEELDESTRINLLLLPSTEGYETHSKTASLIFSTQFSKALDADSLTITVKTLDTFLNEDGTTYTRETMATKTMNAVDATQYYAYGGVLPNVNNDDAEAISWFTENCGGLYPGFNYVDSTHNTIRYFNGVQFDVLTLSEEHAGMILSSVEKDFWTLFQNTSDSQKANLWDLYGYKKEIIASAIATSKLIMYGQGVISSKQISTNPAEDIDSEGFLTKDGYRLEGEEGIIRAKRGFFKDIKIGGNAEIGADANILGEIHNLEEATGEVAFETVKDVGQSATYNAVTRQDGVSIPDAVSNLEWYNYLNAWINANTTNRATYTVSQSRFSNDTSNSVNKMVRISSFSTPTASQSYTTSEVTIYTNPYPFALTSGVSLTITERVVDLFVNYKRSGCAYKVYRSNGTVFSQDSIEFDGNSRVSTARSISSNSIVIPPNGRIAVVWGDGEGSTAVIVAGSASFSLSEQSAIQNTGVYFIKNGSSADYPERLHISSLQAQSGFWTFPNAQELILSITNVGTVRTEKTAAASWGQGVYKYYAFAWHNAPSNTNILGASMFGEGTSFTYAGNNIQIVVARYSSSYLEILDLNGNVYTLSSGYWREHSVNLVILPGFKGARSQNLMPVFVNGERVGNGNIGSPTENWYSGHAEAGWHQDSLRKIKENIEHFDRNALAIINSVDVVSYNLKSDRDKEERYTHYGFIADDTAEELATPFHDKMDYGSCIGILIKAVQELSEEINKLKGEK